MEHPESKLATASQGAAGLVVSPPRGAAGGREDPRYQARSELSVIFLLPERMLALTHSHLALRQR